MTSPFAWYVITRSGRFSRVWVRKFALGNGRCSKCWPLRSLLLMSRDHRTCFWLALVDLLMIHYEEYAISCNQFNLSKIVKLPWSSQKVTLNVLSLNWSLLPVSPVYNEARPHCTWVLWSAWRFTSVLDTKWWLSTSFILYLRALIFFRWFS